MQIWLIHWNTNNGSTDRSTTETIIYPVDEFLQFLFFIQALKKLQRHDLIAKLQCNFVNDIKQALGPNRLL